MRSASATRFPSGPGTRSCAGPALVLGGVLADLRRTLWHTMADEKRTNEPPREQAVEERAEQREQRDKPPVTERATSAPADNRERR